MTSSTGLNHSGWSSEASAGSCGLTGFVVPLLIALHGRRNGWGGGGGSCRAQRRGCGVVSVVSGDE